MKVGEKVRVLHIMSGYGGGISSFIRNQAQYMKEWGIVCDVVTYDACHESFLATIQYTGGDVYQLLNPKTKGWKAFRESFVSVLQNHTYDVVHCHIQGYRVLPYYGLCRRYTQAKFYIHGHYTRDLAGVSLERQMTQWLNRWLSDAYLGCSDDAILTAYGTKIPTQKMMVLPNSIDEHSLLNRHQRGKVESLTIAHIGRLTSIKNHAFTLKLAQTAKENGIDCRWLIVGTGELEQELQEQIHHMGLNEEVSMLGRVEPIADIFDKVDAIVLPSYREGLPTVAIEAQASGIPIIVSDTITQEVDIRVGLIRYLPLDVLRWLETLQQLGKQEPPTVPQRLEALERQCFTNRTAAQLYAAFLKGEVVNHRITTGEQV